MNLSSVCDRCGGSPEPFECDNEDGSLGYETAYYHIVSKGYQDPTTLMSSGAIMFKVAVIKEHPVLEDEKFICACCFDELFEEEDEDDEY